MSSMVRGADAHRSVVATSHVKRFGRTTVPGVTDQKPRSCSSLKPRYGRLNVQGAMPPQAQYAGRC